MILTPAELTDQIAALRQRHDAATVDAVLALLRRYGFTDPISPAEAAQVFGRTQDWVQKAAAAGELDGLRVGEGRRGMLLLGRESVHERKAKGFQPPGRPRRSAYDDDDAE